MELKNAFQCQICFTMWCEPVTFPCGKTICKACTFDGFICCKSCNENLNKQNLNINVLLTSLQNKFIPEVQSLLMIKKSVSKLFLNEQYDLALAKISTSIKLYSTDIYLLNILCKCLLKTNKISTAVCISQKMIELSPLSILGHNRKFDTANKLHICELSPSMLEGEHLSFLPIISSQKYVQLDIFNDNIYELDYLRTIFSIEDFECTICSRLLYLPVATPCGHVFCIECLYRSLDFRPDCPLCKVSLIEFLSARNSKVTSCIQVIIDQLFPTASALRIEMHRNEISPYINDRNAINMPLFVCATAYPSIPCPLHIFEPRYRLMMRRCLLSGTREFGMCRVLVGSSVLDFGTVLFIEDIKYLDDGRSILKTVGLRRFQVKTFGLVDGYVVGNIEYIYDEQISDIKRFNVKSKEIYEKFKQWMNTLYDHQLATIIQAYGELPAFSCIQSPISISSLNPFKRIIYCQSSCEASQANNISEQQSSSDSTQQSYKGSVQNSFSEFADEQPNSKVYSPTMNSTSNVDTTVNLEAQIVVPEYDIRNGPQWLWYAIAILPMPQNFQIEMIKSQKPEFRLNRIQQMLESLFRQN